MLKNPISRVKKTIEEIHSYLLTLNDASLEIEEISDLIRSHPEVKKMEQNYLGLTFTTYIVKSNHIYLKLETKGKDIERVLSFDFEKDNKIICSYRFYDKKKSFKEKIILRKAETEMLSNF